MIGYPSQTPGKKGVDLVQKRTHRLPFKVLVHREIVHKEEADIGDGDALSHRDVHLPKKTPQCASLDNGNAVHNVGDAQSTLVHGLVGVPADNEIYAPRRQALGELDISSVQDGR
jgi:hypothetical protein